jgi:hypothetical protein
VQQEPVVPEKSVVDATFEPDTPQLRDDFERAYKSASLADVATGGLNAAQRVQAVLREKYPDLTISIALGPRWIVTTNQ